MASFPSLTIQKEALIPQGSFAQAQATYLHPDSQSVAELDEVLEQSNVGIVAHYYMDVELQGILSCCSWPHIRISDSLLMADTAVEMAEKGVDKIIVLGVDFMSENVRAVLDYAGYRHIPVYRVDKREIGCSLAQAAEAKAYGAWLHKAKTHNNPVHIIYINTSLLVKALSHATVPTITCTSSNVLHTILQIAHQVPDSTIWYGPDTYMGANIYEVLTELATLDDKTIQDLHPDHNVESIKDLCTRYEYFKQGNCIVHHMFGADVVETVRREYADAYHTAHFEVPGEMFSLASQAQRNGLGVVGSTANILQFIADRVAEAISSDQPQTIPVVLGTEAGMITSIVRKVQTLLQQSTRDDVEVEIIFPVASEAVAQDDTFGIVPGVKGGEGCSTAGGCATCPYMKMNSLDALFSTIEILKKGDAELLKLYEPKKYTQQIGGRSAADLGGEPILFMRHFQRNGTFPQHLVDQIRG
jgi:quinolinate synthase